MRRPVHASLERWRALAIDLRASPSARLWGVGSLAAIHTATRHLEHQHAERYVSRAELARIMGVSVATVDRMVAEGMPSVTWGRRTRRFKPSVAIAWAAERRAS